MAWVEVVMELALKAAPLSNIPASDVLVFHNVCKRLPCTLGSNVQFDRNVDMGVLALAFAKRSCCVSGAC